MDIEREMKRLDREEAEAAADDALLAEIRRINRAPGPVFQGDPEDWLERLARDAEEQRWAKAKLEELRLRSSIRTDHAEAKLLELEADYEKEWGRPYQR